ncbi:MAG: class I SAM-dependent methyltransferase [Planctomycetota bacterium]
MADQNQPLCRPATEEQLENPLKTVDPAGWLGTSIAGKKTLCLAAGGGRQSSLYAAAGADVTVVDLSGRMLELDRATAAQRGHSVRLFETSMDDLSMFQTGEFDLVIHPVSTCYLAEIQPVFREVSRVLRVGGLYISQHKSPTSLQASTRDHPDAGYLISEPYYGSNPVPPTPIQDEVSRRLRERGAVEYVHRWEEIVGGICRSGMVVEDLLEPMHAKSDAAIGSFAHRARLIAPYLRIKARRIANRGSEATQPGSVNQLWIPTD